MSDQSSASEAAAPAPDARVTAAFVAGISKRVMREQPLRWHGDELELADYVVSAWSRVGIQDAMQLNSLTMVMSGFLPALVLTQLAEASDELAWLVSFDLPSVRKTLERSGVAAWCADLGSPLDEAPEVTQATPAAAQAATPADALALVRELQARPDPHDELDAHLVLDGAVAKALPLCHAVLEWVGTERELSRGELRSLLVASLRLLAACRMAGGTVLPAIAWGEPDPDGLESWGAYLLIATLVGLNLRLLAETSSPSERSGLLHFEGEDLQVLAERLDEAGLDTDEVDGT